MTVSGLSFLQLLQKKGRIFGCSPPPALLCLTVTKLYSRCKPCWIVHLSRTHTEQFIIFSMLSTGYWTVKLWIAEGLENIPRDTLPLQIPPKHSYKQLPLQHSHTHSKKPDFLSKLFKEFKHFNYCSYTPGPGWLEQHSVLSDISNSYHRSNLLRASGSQILEFKKFQVTYWEPKNRWFPDRSSRVSPWILKPAKSLIIRYIADKLLNYKLTVFPRLKPKHEVK